MFTHNGKLIFTTLNVYMYTTLEINIKNGVNIF